MNRMRAGLLAGVTVGIALLATTPASGAPQADAAASLTKSEARQLEDRMAEQLRRHPGGKAVSRNSVSYDNGSVVVTLPLKDGAAKGPAGASGVPDCDRGSVCLYEHDNFNGLRVSFYRCEMHSLGSFTDKMTSWHNNQTGGVQAVMYDVDGNGRIYDYDRLVVGQNPNVGRALNDRANLIRPC
ncbi:peptidase inhibitor family I36 protein [Streptomyces erythrochromogenes]|uniref:peptidase inhibitor family I36 protein n=1 Tax=Streptomyces erythrochromogenes TaxID=285574 RepID=UPI003862E6C1|nr:peptidase inhibitor family I36 protein [Streptomyces erythrochromogenes]